jgi:antitoxin component YwqK of YwqJK toxin-antitoxin module
MPVQPLQKRTTFVRDGMTINLEDGILDSEIPIGDGIAKFYHPNGSVRAEVPKVAGETHGISRKWHDNGRLAQETEYIAGKVQGLARDWDRDGSLLHELDYVTPNAIFGKTYADVGRVRKVFLWNGKPISKSKWIQKVEAAGVSKLNNLARLRATVTAESAMSC